MLDIEFQKKDTPSSFPTKEAVKIRSDASVLS